MRSHITRRCTFVLGLAACAGLIAPAVRADERPPIPPGGRTRANGLTRMAVPKANRDKPVLIDILDPWDQPIWTGASRESTFEFFTRDWADGMYTVRFQPGGQQRLRVETELFGKVRARVGLMLRAIEPQRDADGLAPPRLQGASNLLQRIMTLFVWTQPSEAVEGHLAFCEQQLGHKTAAATVRILGSGSSKFTGYDGPYRPFARERSMMFVPPNAVVDFAANGERKLKRWGYRPGDVDHVFITHEHGDHFDIQAIVRFAQSRGNDPTLVVHAGKTVCERLVAYLSVLRTSAPIIEIDELKPFVETQAGELRVKPVPATHQAGPTPLCYILRWRGTTVYYGTDSGYPSAETLAALARERFDVFAHDVTVASADDGVTHQDLGDFVLLVGKLRAAGAIDAWTRVVTLHQDKKEGPQILPDWNHFERQVGFECSYDGMPIPIAFRIEQRHK